MYTGIPRCHKKLTSLSPVATQTASLMKETPALLNVLTTTAEEKKTLNPLRIDHKEVEIK
jgi:hypothetical protein